jgi:hypothetical protein
MRYNCARQIQVGITDAMVGYIQARGGAEEFYDDED